MVMTAFGLGLAAFVGFIAWELHTDHPMLDMRIFRNPRFSAASGRSRWSSSPCSARCSS